MGKEKMCWIKTSSTGKIRLFFHILNHPWATLQAINEFREEHGKLEVELVELKSKLSDAMFANIKLKEELYSLKQGQKVGVEI